MDPPQTKKKRNSEAAECVASTSSGAVGNSYIENFIPNCELITSNIFKYLSGKDILNFSRVSKSWFHPCRDYFHRKGLQCCVVLDKVDGLAALESLHKVLDNKMLGYNHPFNGIHFKFSDPFDFFFKVGTGPYQRPPTVKTAADDPENFDFGAAMFNFDEPDDNSQNDDYGDERHDYSQDYESFPEWMDRQIEEKREWHRELAKLDQPLKRIFAKIPAMRHVHLVADYGKKRAFEAQKFSRFIKLLPLNQIEYFRTNIRISEFTGNLNQGQLSNLKTLHIDGLMSALPSSLNHLFAVCPALEHWDSPIPGNVVAFFGSKKHMIKSLVLYNFVKPRDFTQIRDAKLSLTTLIANATSCPIGKTSFDLIIDLMRDQRDTLNTIQISEAFLKHVLNSTMPPMTSIRTILIGKSSKAIKVKALEKFPNAKFVERTK